MTIIKKSSIENKKMSLINNFEGPHNITERKGRNEEKNVELDEIRDATQTEDEERLYEFEEKKKVFPNPKLTRKIEIGVPKERLEEYSDQDHENPEDEIIDKIDNPEKETEEELEEIRGPKRAFIPGVIGHKIAQINKKFFRKDWKKLDSSEQDKINKEKQKEIEKLFLKK